MCSKYTVNFTFGARSEWPKTMKCGQDPDEEDIEQAYDHLGCMWLYTLNLRDYLVSTIRLHAKKEDAVGPEFKVKCQTVFARRAGLQLIS